MKRKNVMRTALSVLLVLAMVLGIVGCGAKQATVNDAPNAPQLSVQQPDSSEQPSQGEALTREEKEQIADLLSDGTIDPGKLSDKELDQVVQNLTAELEKPAPEVEFNSGAYDENGAMKEPFDQVYPELVEKGEVEYDDESLLLKLSGDRVTDSLKSAGVAALECIVPMENYAWYEAKLVSGTDAQKALAQLRELKEVKLAEYNYQIKTAEIDHYKDFGDRYEFGKNEHHDKQWHMHHCGIPDGFEEVKIGGGSSSVVVAVIDTGVDYDHEDLSQNIWVNADEIPDNGIDDDQNGYVDDYYGVNIVAGKGNGDDDNGHGTHVAGIIAAQDNNLGTVGIAYNVKIMPIKAAMASGYLHQSDIAKAILYAYENGAEIINMSFGGTACSIAVQDALETAYTRCVLVASAGNDGSPNQGMYAVPSYPAALTYVLGVMSVDQTGRESGFSNYDVIAFNSIEYELYAPGDSIMSTLPNNRYGQLSGTSMAAPVVSAMAAILRSEFSDRDIYPTKFIYGQLAATSGYNATCLDPELHGTHNLPQIVDLYSALTKMPTPEVNYQEYALFDTEGFEQDTNGMNNGDGVVDAGETIALGLTLRNRWGMSKNTLVSIDTLSMAGIADPYITILNPTVDYGSVGTYSTQDCGRIYTDELLTGWEDPFYIQIAKDCPNDYIFKLNVSIRCENALDEDDRTTYTSSAQINLTVRNGVLLPAVIEEDMVLTADNLYIIPNSTMIKEGTTVRVEPGTHIQFWSDDEKDPYSDNYIAYLRVDGNFLVEGTKENPVYLYPSDLRDNFVVEFGERNDGFVSLRYADITNFNVNPGNTDRTISVAYGCTFRQNYGGYMYYRYLSNGAVYTSSLSARNFGTIRQAENCVFYKLNYAHFGSYNYSEITNCLFAECGFSFSDNNSYEKLRNCVFLGNYFRDQTNPDYYYNSSLKVSGQSSSISASSSSVYYCPETGTSYVRLSTYNDIDVVHEYIKTLGGDYAVLETEEEYNWVNAAFAADGYNFYCDLGIRYDPKQQIITWADGTALPEFLQVEGLTDVYRGQYICMEDGVLTKGSISSYLFEIPGPVYLTDLQLPEYELLLDLDTGYQLTATSQPKDVPAEELIFESKDEAVVTVDEKGYITPVGFGTADVYVYSFDKAVYNYVTVCVRDYCGLESIDLSAPSQELAIGDTMSLTAALTPVDTTRRNVTYTTSDPAIATVDLAGQVTGVGSGSVTITATSAELDSEGNPITASVTLTVYQKATALSLGIPTMMATLSSKTAELPQVTTDAGAEPVLYWSVSDPAVAELQENQLILKGLGTAALAVTDLRSGLSASCLLVVQETALSQVKKIQVDDSEHYVLLENGNLYHWCDDIHFNPILVLDDVQMFDAYGGTATVLRESGALEEWGLWNAEPRKSNTFDLTAIGDQKLAGFVNVRSNSSPVFVWTEEGYVYARGGSNADGSLGLGTTAAVTTFTLVMLENVVDVQCYSDDYTYFLTGNGDLYMAGGGYTTPVLIGQDVAELLCVNSYHAVVLFKNGWIGTCAVNGISTQQDVSDYEAISCYNSAWIGIRDGVAYISDCYNHDFTAIPGITNAKMVYTYSDAYYIVTEDGLLYGYGSNGASFNHMAGMTNANPVTEPVLLPMGALAQEEASVIDSNLQELNVLTEEGKLLYVLNEETLELTFNKAIIKAAPKLYANGGQIVCGFNVHDLNRMTVTKSGGFLEDTVYELVFEADSISAAAGVTNPQEIRITFTAEPPVKEDAVTENAPVIHEAVLDETVERFYWTPENFVEKIEEIRTQLHLNPYFMGNVVLNHISTDTDVNHWLRPLAASYNNYTEIPLGGNYWASNNKTAIELQMIDFTDFTSYARLMYAPYLEEAPENVFPFVTGLTILNKDGEAVRTVGNEQITVRVTFNRDMDTTLPLLVRFGSAYPYGDYEIPGTYVDARTWEGTYTLKTIIENGNQCFTISQGRTADGELELYTDRGRFGFVIDTTAAQALIMQGTAEDTGISLRWTQDDFDTLMGYNVYRSTAEDGLYTKLNATVIPADQMAFFDDTVEPGQIYYYNFTVVKTDLTESEPSGKIVIMSKDTMAPNIYHSPVANAFTGSNLVVTATVTDNLSIIYAELYYRMVGETDWKIIRMNDLNDKYSAIIPAQYVTTAGIEYYIDAFDGVSHTYKGTEDAPYTIAVQEVVDASSLGDVDGDGIITNLDALLLLYAINDKYNLTAEEFARADLNGDGELWAAEALRILQYVSGVVGSVKM